MLCRGCVGLHVCYNNILMILEVESLCRICVYWFSTRLFDVTFDVLMAFRGITKKTCI